MKKLLLLSMFLQRAFLIFLAIAFSVIFLATGHELDATDSNQMLYFLPLILFFVSFFVLVAFKVRQDFDKQIIPYVGVIVALVVTLATMLFIAWKILSVEYASFTPNVIVDVLFLGIINGAFLLYIFLFRKDLLVHEGDGN